MLENSVNCQPILCFTNFYFFPPAFETRKHFGIVMEHVPGGELFEYVQKQEGIAESGAKEMFEEIVKGVKHCHSQGVAHRDLKLENILLDSSNKPKVRSTSG